MLRKALIKDGEEIHRLINLSSSKGEMLPRSLSEIYDNIRDFFVFEEDGKILGICSLHIFWKDLAEIRSLYVDESKRKKGIGRKLVEACLSEAKEFGIRKVFLLTYRTDFFLKLGFKTVEKVELPQKIWSDCVKCPKFPKCDEVAMIKNLGEEDEGKD